jgi:hypothetical protein
MGEVLGAVMACTECRAAAPLGGAARCTLDAVPSAPVHLHITPRRASTVRLTVVQAGNDGRLLNASHGRGHGAADG